MKLITKALTEQLLANGRAQRAAIDFQPVVKLFTPDAQCGLALICVPRVPVGNAENHRVRSP